MIQASLSFNLFSMTTVKTHAKVSVRSACVSESKNEVVSTVTPFDFLMKNKCYTVPINSVALTS